jgi:hypothetical protein
VVSTPRHILLEWPRIGDKMNIGIMPSRKKIYKRNVNRVLVGNPESKKPLPGVDWRIILKWIIEKDDGND